MLENILFPAEWHKQDFVQLTWPHEATDWSEYLDEAYRCFIDIASAIVKYQKLLIVCKDVDFVKKQLCALNQDQIIYINAENNDTWARDHGGITVLKNGKPVVYDFKFNGWGQKFAANYDNQITKNIFKKLSLGAQYENHLDFVFEGGSIESNGNGVLMTTEECLLSVNRNEQFNKSDIEANLLKWFGAKKIIWLSNGFLSGDDTDSHIDTLARFVGENKIMYVKCEDRNDVHYEALKAMESELQKATDVNNKKFELIALPMSSPIYESDGFRLPATYANFLMINDAILMPIYGVETDKLAIEIFEKTFPEKDIIPINCAVLIRQHGSLHCVTMQYPKGVLKSL